MGLSENSEINKVSKSLRHIVIGQIELLKGLFVLPFFNDQKNVDYA